MMPAPNGRIYHVPSGAEQVVSLHPETEAAQIDGLDPGDGRRLHIAPQGKQQYRMSRKN